MNDEIKKAIDNFLEEFKNLPVVKNYISLKKMMKIDSDFLKLKNDLKESQKVLALSINTPSYQDNKIIFEKLKEKYENHPYIINYNVYEEEIRHLLKEIEINLKIKND